MRLINTKTMQLEEFASHREQTYTILSHRWGKDEVSFEEWNYPQSKLKQGYRKIEGFCHLVLERHEEGAFSPYAWVDTCCIDKRSSAELSEAINSMYEWYKDAECCCVFLSDVEVTDDVPSSTWFTRCWTLQELIAPEIVFFYNRDWMLLGSKVSLETTIVQASRVEKEVLRGKLIFEYSIARRMSWAATRFATRLEDKAYSLMGMFEVNMPMLYGEGGKAFIRLQEEIIRRSDDHSIFTWRLSHNFAASTYKHTYSGLLSNDPSTHQSHTNIVRCEPLIQPKGYSLTNIGLSITLAAVPYDMDVYCAILHCTTNVRLKDKEYMCIFLRQLSKNSQYVRVRDSHNKMGESFILPFQEKYHWLRSGGRFRTRKFLVQQNARMEPSPTYYGFRCRNEDFNIIKNSASVSADGPGEWVTAYTPGMAGTHCIFSFWPGQKFTIHMALGLDFDFNPVIYIQACLIRDTKDNVDPNLENSEWINQATTDIDDFLDGTVTNTYVTPQIRTWVIRNPRDQSLQIEMAWAGLKAVLQETPLNIPRHGASHVWTLHIQSTHSLDRYKTQAQRKTTSSKL